MTFLISGYLGPFSVIVNEINNSAALNAFKAVEKYLDTAKIPGLSLGKVNRVELDSTKKYLTVDDGTDFRILFDFFSDTN